MLTISIYIHIANTLQINSIDNNKYISLLYFTGHFTCIYYDKQNT